MYVIIKKNVDWRTSLKEHSIKHDEGIWKIKSIIIKTRLTNNSIRRI